MNESLSPEAALAALAWQIELGADEAIGDVPVDRFALPDAAPRPRRAAPAAAALLEPAPAADPVGTATTAAARAGSLADLAAAMQAYPYCPLRETARTFVFADGRPEARVMIVGEAPGRDEDRLGKPFVGRAGQLLDKMLAAVELGRDHPDPRKSVYITNVLPWRPPGNRTPTPDEIAMLLPFVLRHIELAAPDLLVLMGNTPCQALLGRAGITRIRGQWAEVAGRPALPMFHPAYLLRTPAAKRETWADLLDLAARLDA